MRYNLYCSPKPYGTSVPPFSSTKCYLPSNSSVSKLLSIQHFDNIPLVNLLTTILPNGKPLAHQSLLTPSHLPSSDPLLCPVSDKTPVPTTRTFSIETSPPWCFPCLLPITPFGQVYLHLLFSITTLHCPVLWQTNSWAINRCRLTPINYWQCSSTGY